MKKPCDTVELVAQMLENEFDAMPPTARDIASKLIQVVTCNDHGNGSIDEMKQPVKTKAAFFKDLWPSYRKDMTDSIVDMCTELALQGCVGLKITYKDGELQSEVVTKSEMTEHCGVPFRDHINDPNTDKELFLKWIQQSQRTNSERVAGAKELSRLNTTPNPNAYAINKQYPKAR